MSPLRWTLSLLIGSLSCIAASGAALASTQRVLVYDVENSRYGDVGTYRNTIEAEGGKTTVKTDGNIEVSFLGIVAYRQSINRVEHWNGDQLTSFDGITVENGTTTEVSGALQGDSFVVHSPRGAVAAPRTIRPANPWSKDIVSANAVFTPDEGIVERLRLVGKDDTTVMIADAEVPAQHYEMTRLDNSKHYDVWLSASGTPIKFSVARGEDVTTFTLRPS
jgi:hypothetical protein